MRILVLALLFIVGADSAMAAKRPMTVDDALNLVSVGDALMSPDGKNVFYSKTELVWEENDYKTTYFMTSAEGGEAIQYIGDAGGEAIQFSPDGRYLSLMRDVDDSPQLFIMPTTGGDAVQLTSHRGRINAYKWTGDSSTLIFSADEPRSEEEEREHKLGADPVFVDEAPNGKEEARFSNLWAFDLRNKTETRLSDADFIVENFDVSPDGSRVVLIGVPDSRTNYVHMAELYLLEVNTKKLTRLTHNDAMEESPLWAPDGKTFAYRATSDKSFEMNAGYFWVMNPDTGSNRKLQGQDQGLLDEYATIAWTEDGTGLLFTEQQRTHHNIYKVDVRTGEATALSKSAGTLSALSFSKDRKRMVVSYQDLATPPDLYVSRLGDRPITSLQKAVRITDANPWFREEIQLSEGENLHWTSKGDMEIEGIFMPALNHGGGKMPMILHVHGGPNYYAANIFRPDFQILTGLGYAILSPNFRGSMGYGDEFVNALAGEVGDGEFVDLMTGVDYVIAHKNIDQDRLGIRGWSWGGVSTGYTITQTQRFKAASIGAMVSNWAAETGPGFNYDVRHWYIGGTPWDNAEEWAKRSSITHVKNITTPSLILHGGSDTQSSVGQSLMFFTAIRDIGKAPVRYIKFPRERHRIHEPRLSRIYQIEECKWFKKYIDGEDWQPWVRAKSALQTNNLITRGQ